MFTNTIKTPNKGKECLSFGAQEVRKILNICEEKPKSKNKMNSILNFQSKFLPHNWF